MNRRSFLSMLGLAAVAVPLARLLPPVADVRTPLTDVFPDGLALGPRAGIFEVQGMRGVPYLINNTGYYFGFTRHRFSDYEPMVTAKEIAERERWYDALPKNRSLIPEDYRRG